MDGRPDYSRLFSSGLYGNPSAGTPSAPPGLLSPVLGDTASGSAYPGGGTSSMRPPPGPGPPPVTSSTVGGSPVAGSSAMAGTSLAATAQQYHDRYLAAAAAQYSALHGSAVPVTYPSASLMSRYLDTSGAPSPGSGAPAGGSSSSAAALLDHYKNLMAQGLMPPPASYWPDHVAAPAPAMSHLPGAPATGAPPPPSSLYQHGFLPAHFSSLSSSSSSSLSSASVVDADYYTHHHRAAAVAAAAAAAVLSQQQQQQQNEEAAAITQYMIAQQQQHQQRDAAAAWLLPPPHPLGLAHHPPLYAGGAGGDPLASSSALSQLAAIGAQHQVIAQHQVKHESEQQQRREQQQQQQQQQQQRVKDERNVAGSPGRCPSRSMDAARYRSGSSDHHTQQRSASTNHRSSSTDHQLRMRRSSSELRSPPATGSGNRTCTGDLADRRMSSEHARGRDLIRTQIIIPGARDNSNNRDYRVKEDSSHGDRDYRIKEDKQLTQLSPMKRKTTTSEGLADDSNSNKVKDHQDSNRVCSQHSVDSILEVRPIKDEMPSPPRRKEVVVGGRETRGQSLDTSHSNIRVDSVDNDGDNGKDNGKGGGEAHSSNIPVKVEPGLNAATKDSTNGMENRPQKPTDNTDSVHCSSPEKSMVVDQESTLDQIKTEDSSSSGSSSSGSDTSDGSSSSSKSSSSASPSPVPKAAAMFLKEERASPTDQEQERPPRDFTLPSFQYSISPPNNNNGVGPGRKVHATTYMPQVGTIPSPSVKDPNVAPHFDAVSADLNRVKSERSENGDKSTEQNGTDEGVKKANEKSTPTKGKGKKSSPQLNRRISLPKKDGKSTVGLNFLPRNGSDKSGTESNAARNDGKADIDVRTVKDEAVADSPEKCDVNKANNNTVSKGASSNNDQQQATAVVDLQKSASLNVSSSLSIHTNPYVMPPAFDPRISHLYSEEERKRVLDTGWPYIFYDANLSPNSNQQLVHKDTDVVNIKRSPSATITQQQQGNNNNGLPASSSPSTEVSTDNRPTRHSEFTSTPTPSKIHAAVGLVGKSTNPGTIATNTGASTSKAVVLPTPAVGVDGAGGEGYKKDTAGGGLGRGDEGASAPVRDLGITALSFQLKPTPTSAVYSAAGDSKEILPTEVYDIT